MPPPPPRMPRAKLSALLVPDAIIKGPIVTREYMSAPATPRPFVKSVKVNGPVQMDAGAGKENANVQPMSPRPLRQQLQQQSGQAQDPAQESAAGVKPQPVNDDRKRNRIAAMMAAVSGLSSSSASVSAPTTLA